VEVLEEGERLPFTLVQVVWGYEIHFTQHRTSAVPRSKYETRDKRQNHR